MLFTEVATGRMNCRGGKKDSGRVILGPWREKVSRQKTKLICCQGVQHGKKRHAQQWCLIVLFILAALSVVREKKKPSPESTNANAEEFWPAWSNGPT